MPSGSVPGADTVAISPTPTKPSVRSTCTSIPVALHYTTSSSPSSPHSFGPTYPPRQLPHRLFLHHRPSKSGARAAAGSCPPSRLPRIREASSSSPRGSIGGLGKGTSDTVLRSSGGGKRRRERSERVGGGFGGERRQKLWWPYWAEGRRGRSRPRRQSLGGEHRQYPSQSHLSLRHQRVD